MWPSDPASGVVAWRAAITPRLLPAALAGLCMAAGQAWAGGTLFRSWAPTPPMGWNS